jgi:hypothetical protein
LIDVLGIALRPGDPERDSQNSLIVSVYQLLERGSVAALHFANQKTILDTACALHYLSPRPLHRRVNSPDEAFQTLNFT